MEEQIQKLSSTIVNYSLKIKENDRVLITTHNVLTAPLIKQLIQDIVSSKGIPFVRIIDPTINAELMENTNDERIKDLVEENQYDVDHYDCFISVRYINNDYESKNINKDIRQKVGAALEKTDDIRINQRRWVLLNYPSHLDAYKAQMTNEEFTQYAFDVMTFDYDKMYEDVKPLKELMEKTDKVRMVGPNTDITFSIKGMPAIPCCGESNIPDGECYTAPLRDSVNGVITYNTPSPYQGRIFHNVSLTFENGKIVKCECLENQQQLEEIFNTDEGARYIGEFSFGLNPLITKPMGDILYDEKIIGSIHFTPGRAYANCDNGNKSAIHWDMVWIQREDYGGGEVYFDDQLIRKDGIFVLPELQHLNYLK